MLEFSSVQERIDGLKKQEAALQQSVEMLQGSAEHGKAESSEDDQIRISELTQEIEELRKRNEALNEEIGLHKERFSQQNGIIGKASETRQKTTMTNS